MSCVDVPGIQAEPELPSSEKCLPGIDIPRFPAIFICFCCALPVPSPWSLHPTVSLLQLLNHLQLEGLAPRRLQIAEMPSDSAA